MQIFHLFTLFSFFICLNGSSSCRSRPGSMPSDIVRPEFVKGPLQIPDVCKPYHYNHHPISFLSNHINHMFNILLLYFLLQGDYYIFADHSGLVLQSNPRESTGPSQPRVMQYQLTGSLSQKYRLHQTAENVGYYYVESLESGLYWDIGGSTFDDYESLTEFRFHGKQNQQFRFDPIGNGTDLYRIVVRHSNKVLDVHWNSKENGANVIQHNYNGGNNQKFRLISAKKF